MKTDCGLYASVTPDGTLKRDLAAIHVNASDKMQENAEEKM